jgi:DNA-binding NarL/FixJ family response regulator
MTQPRIMLADDHRLMLEGLQRLLHGHGEVVGTFEDGQSLLQAAQLLKPDLVLLDISMPVMNGLDTARQLKVHLPGCKIIFLTMHADPMYAAEAFIAGGCGYVLKRSAATELIQAIEVVLGGKPYASPGVVKDLLLPLLEGTVRLDAADGISAREREVLRMMAEGRPATEIAEGLNISVREAVEDISRIIEVLNLQRASR